MKISFDIALAIIFGVTSLLGTAGTFYFAYRSSKLAREKFRFSWHDVHQAANTLSRSAIKQYKPDLLISFPGGPSILANLMLENQQYFVQQLCIPIGVLKPKTIVGQPIPGYIHLIATDFEFFVPASILDKLDKATTKILIVEDATRMNESTITLKKHLLERGFANENIKTLSMVIANQIYLSNSRPDYYSYVVNISDFYLPWGQI